MPVKKNATYDDLLSAPENMVAELIDGDLYTWPRPRARDGHARHGVPWAWYVDTDARTFEVMRLHDGHWQIVHVYTDDEVIRIEPFPLAEIKLGLIWA